MRCYTILKLRIYKARQTMRCYRALMFSWPYAGMAGIQCTQIVKAAQAAMTEMDWHDVALTP